MGPTNPTEEYFRRGGWGYDGTRWRKLALLWGYTDRVIEPIEDTNADAGLNVLQGTAVPAGYVYEINAIAARDKDNDPSNIILMVSDGSNAVPLEYQASPGANAWVFWNGAIRLKEDDYVQANINGCTAGDDIELRYWGTSMAVV